MRTMTAHARAVVLCCWMTALSWSFPAAAQALGDATLSTGLRGYDFESIGWGILVAAVGGFGRRVLTLLSPNVIVIDALREAWKDLFIAALAGAVGTVGLMAWQSVFDPVPVPLAVLILAACGWARMGTFVWAERYVKAWAERGEHHVADTIANPKQGGEP